MSTEILANENNKPKDCRNCHEPEATLEQDSVDSLEYWVCKCCDHAHLITIG